MVSSEGEELKEKAKGVGSRVVKMVDGVIYDTDKAEAICHTSKFTGSFFELYQDAEGQKFIVLYADWLEDGIVMPVDESHAHEFAEACMYKAGL